MAQPAAIQTAQTNSPACYDYVATVTPSDSTSFNTPCRALYVQGAGALVVLLVDGTTVTTQTIPAFTLLPWRVARVNSTGTVATNILALW